jgi:hypothetical protein
MSRRTIAWCLLALSTLAGLFTAGKLLFAIWMTAYYHDAHAWQIRVYEMFAVTVLDGLIWVGSIVWLWRMGKSRETSV